MSASDQSTAASQGHFETIDLPRELRDKIYRELLIPETTRNPNDLHPTYDLEPAILRVNKQTHAEAARVLYGENTWILFEIYSNRLFENLGTPMHHRTFWRHIEDYPDVPALKVDIHGPMNDNIDKKLLLNYCDLPLFFDCVLRLILRTSSEEYGWELMDFDFQFNARNRDEEESLVDFFQDVRGAREVSVEGTRVLSTGRELATLMMTPIARIDEVYERASLYQARGDKYFGFMKYQKAMETYRHGFEYVDSLSHLYKWHWGEGNLEDVTPLNVRSLNTKELSLWFACALCNLKLGKGMFQDVWIARKPGLHVYQDPAIGSDGFDEAMDLLVQGDPKRGLEVVLSVLRGYPAHQRVDEEIDYMEAQLRSIFPKTPTGCQQIAGRAHNILGV